MSNTLQDAGALRDEIRAYRDVARDPDGEYHFETGRPLAARLGYPPAWLDAVAPAALARFAGVGHFLDLAEIEPARRFWTSVRAQAPTRASPHI